MAKTYKRSYAKKASTKLVKTIKRVAKQTMQKATEWKFTYGTGNYNTSTTLSIYQLNSLITVGTADFNNRIGDKYHIKAGQIGFNVSNADPTNILRMVVFQWNDIDVPVPSSLFEDSSTIGMLLGSFNGDSLRSKGLHIILDKHLALNTYNPNYTVRVKLNMKGCKPCCMNGGSATVGNGNIYIAFLSDSSLTAHPIIQYAFKFNYIDI